MSKVIYFALFLVAGLCSVNVSLAAGDKSPAQSPVQAPPAPAASARADSGYRTYSYEPGTSYRSFSRSSSFRRPGFLDARTKTLGY
jgi:hypothetical protein